MNQALRTRATPARVAAIPCTAACVRRVARRMTAYYEQYLAATGISLSQYSLLSNLSDTAQSQSALAARLEMDRTTLTRNLKPMLDKGWVATVHGSDARQRLCKLTARGRKARAGARESWKRAQGALERQLGTKLIANLHLQLDAALARLKPELPEEN